MATVPTKRTVNEVLTALEGIPNKTLLIRVDFNVPMNDQGEITDDSRIQGALPTIRKVVDAGCNAVLVSHMGRPKKVQTDNDPQERQKLSLRPIANHLSTLLDQQVLFASDCMDADGTVAQLKGGQICVLENLRFYKQEEKNDAKFAQKLASYAHGYINDAFGTAHRAHASTHGVPDAMTDKTLCGVGLLIQSELEYLDFSKGNQQDCQITAIIGGSKVSTKLPVIQGLLNTVDNLILGGGLAFTFLKAQGIPIGDSLCEEGMIDTARDLLEQAKKAGKHIYLPLDAVCADHFPKSDMTLAQTKTFPMTREGGIPDGYMGLDCGPETIESLKPVLQASTKICFNGPMGVFEVKPFDEGTKALVDQLEYVTRECNVTTVVGGGDSVSALKQFGKLDSVSYVSTGGGATLELLAGDKLPGVEIIPNLE